MVNLDQVAIEDLPCGDQPGQRLNDKAFDGTFKVPRAVLNIRTFVEEKLFSRRRYCKSEATAGIELENPPSDSVQFHLKDAIELAIPERFEDHHLIERINELRRESAACGLDAGATHVVAQGYVAVQRIHMRLNRSGESQL